MKGNITVLLFTLILFFLIDLYVYSGIKVLTSDVSTNLRKIIHTIYWMYSIFIFVVFFFMYKGAYTQWAPIIRTIVFGSMMIFFTTKLVFALFLLVDDVQRFVRWMVLFIPTYNNGQGEVITRNQFLVKVGAYASLVPLVGMTYGVLFGAHKYTVHKVKLKLANLPDAWKGLKIVQISDIHSGSFYDKKSLQQGIDLINEQGADLILFTGDLVNYIATEIEPYLDMFSKLKAPMGVYSVLGNHDYGDYFAFKNFDDKRENLIKLKQYHATMGWRLLMNEHVMFDREGEKIALIGIENWGAKGHFPKYGDMQKAYSNTEAAKVKLLLSHDPSHWDAQVKTEYKDIDVMFAGHTHGFQFGIEKGPFKWSPVQWVYKQWAGLYQDGNQYLYVNRGFGYIGFPGRVGIYPEITVIELTN
jgi:predicted MPP superfamily phosphohydrolase